MGRWIVLILLGLSALQFLFAAIVFGFLVDTEDGKQLSAIFILLFGVALALAVAFRKSGAPTWKHKLAVAVIALPAALQLVLQ